jgi:hypothetical protein
MPVTFIRSFQYEVRSLFTIIIECGRIFNTSMVYLNGAVCCTTDHAVSWRVLMSGVLDSVWALVYQVPVSQVCVPDIRFSHENYPTSA